ncbi:YgaP-like transmembrane domain [Dyadobacter bucti]|uniref:YgaP-like transmembrane domain n=1 Tax=Dyadobacter bucti TaxID=2572203 RepID=UPI001108D64F|nr:YgaP-like transmembrane domain [Dyadobacter bucti]
MQTTTEKIKEKAQEVTQLAAKNQNLGKTERIISGVAAALLAVYAVKKKNTLLGNGLTAASGFLFTRATTGICPVNKAIGRNSLIA